MQTFLDTWITGQQDISSFLEAFGHHALENGSLTCDRREKSKTWINVLSFLTVKNMSDVIYSLGMKLQQLFKIPQEKKYKNAISNAPV